jgi:hypothetical protein
MKTPISSTSFWKRADGTPLNPLEVVTLDDVESGRILPCDSTRLEEALRILREKPEDVWPKQP